MKNIILTCAFVLVAFSGFAQEASTKKSKAIQVIELSSGSQFEVAIKPLMNSIPEENRQAFKAEVMESLKGLYDQMADIYMESYTEGDLDAILAFYNSPVGKKMVEKTPEITEKSMQLGQVWGMQLQPIMAKYQN